MNYCFKTDKGVVRDNNEDSGEIFVNNNGDVFLAVLDGMGGHASGKTASHMALRELKNQLLKKDHFRTTFGFVSFVMKAIKKANYVVNDLGSSSIQYRDMGTTLVLAVIHKDELFVFNVGDSRCYVIDDAHLVQLSEDQTYVQFLYKTGKIKKEEMTTHPKRHVLMNALGTYPTITTVNRRFRKKYPKILLCSDGLYNMVEETQIEDIILNEELSTEAKVDNLINLANANGGKDNIAVALWEDK
jgi:protein phosphatase